MAYALPLYDDSSSDSDDDDVVVAYMARAGAVANRQPRVQRIRFVAADRGWLMDKLGDYEFRVHLRMTKEAFTRLEEVIKIVLKCVFV